MLVGAVDVITEVVLAGFNSMRLLTQHRTRPFAEDRDGFILAEGAAFMVMEEAGHAAARSALARARVLGWGASSDSTHLTTPDPVGIARSLRAALADAGRSPGQISVFYAHGTASAVNDRAESDAVLDVFVQESAPVTTAAIKSALGHAEGAAGMFAIVAAVEGLNRGKVPPVLGVERPDPATAHLMLADHQTSHPHGDVMVHASGFGGTNCTVLLGPAPSQGRDAPVGHRVPTRTRPPGIPVAVAAATATEAEAVARGFHPEWSPEGGPVPATPPRSPRPDQSCLLLSAAVAALLGGLPMTERHKMLRGGLLTGTEHGGQRHHARMHAGLRKRGARGVDPLDFALSTYNAPAAMTSIMLGFHGQTEAFLGATAGVEALVTGAWLIASGRVGGIVCAGWDAPENRLWAAPGAPSVPARATALALCPVGTDWEGAGVSLAGIAGVRRLSFAAHPASPEAFEEIAGQFNPGEPDMLVATGLAGQEADTLSGAGWTVLPPEGGAAAPLGAHVATIERIAAGQARDAIVVSTAASGATIAVHYTVIAAGRYE
jgi:3-oxoacyl-(acyl-carrier-protein) synthase